MTKYYYFDQINKKRGLFNVQELRELATRGIITPHTPMETDTGYKGVAGQIPGLFDNVPAVQTLLPLPQALQVPLTTIPDAQRRKARIHFWTMALIISLAIFTIVSSVPHIFAVIFPESMQSIADGELIEEESLSYLEIVLALWFILCLLASAVAFLICYCFFVHRLWEEIPSEFARTTPLKAALLMLIPIFHWYWQFIAFCGLYRNMNEVMEVYGFGHRFHESFIQLVCVVWLVWSVLGMLLAIGNAWGLTDAVPLYVSLVLLLIDVISTIVFCVVYWIICEDIIRFIDIKSGTPIARL